MKILRINRGRNVYRVEGKADETLRLLTENGKHEIKQTGQIIRSLGGIDRVNPCALSIRKMISMQNAVQSTIKPACALKFGNSCAWIARRQ